MSVFQQQLLLLPQYLSHQHPEQLYVQPRKKENRQSFWADNSHLRDESDPF